MNEQALRAEIADLRAQVRYLRFVVWKLSVRDLAQQHAKYQVWQKQSCVSEREPEARNGDLPT